MTWNECLDQGIITHREPDPSRARAMRDLALSRLSFWEGVHNRSAITLKTEAYYEIIKELIFAHLYRAGYNCTNHLCLIPFVNRHFGKLAAHCSVIDTLRKIRNNISYRGMHVELDYLERHEPRFLRIIALLQENLS